MAGMHGWQLLAGGVAWVGHACIWTGLLNHLYGRPWPKSFLKAWRYATGVVILAFPLLAASGAGSAADPWSGVARVYGWLCLVVGAGVFPVVTVVRLCRRPPACVVAETTRTRDFWPEAGSGLVGDGYLAGVARLPGNAVFRLDVTELTLALPALPPAWDGLELLVVSDTHFHGTPARPYFDRVVDELLAQPLPDVVCLLGDYVDTDQHHDWIVPVLGRLAAAEGKFAVLGNHDAHHDPARVRSALRSAGYTVVGNGWVRATVRGTECLVIGHEGPWFAPPPDLAAAPPTAFRLCLSHTPDNFYWGVSQRIGLMLCGHVHGGAIRLPVVGPIFVPSIYGRRFDQGVFVRGGTVMVVGRGLSGKEPLRFRCNPQVLRVRLRPAARVGLTSSGTATASAPSS